MRMDKAGRPKRPGESDDAVLKEMPDQPVKSRGSKLIPAPNRVPINRKKRDLDDKDVVQRTTSS